jgi:fermentation-respiration switch protein FrsA (DUF1100 family)
VRWPRRRRSRLRRVLLVVLLVVVLLAAYSVFVGWALTHPAREPLKTTPAAYGLPYRAVTFPSLAGHLDLRGWWIPPARPAGITVIFAHGYTDNREGFPALFLARAVHAMGAGVLMFDFRAEGQSPGRLVSVGEYEQYDLDGAVLAVARRFAPGTKIVLVGFSMGAATALLSAAAMPQVAGVVADSPFADLEPYLWQNLPVWTHLPAFPFNAFILSLLPPLVGMDPTKVDPLAAVRHLGHRPLLLIAGRADKAIPYRNSVLLYDTARRTDPSAALWLVPRADHVEAFAVAPVAYVERLYRFLHAIDPAVRPFTGNGW